MAQGTKAPQRIERASLRGLLFIVTLALLTVAATPSPAVTGATPIPAPETPGADGAALEAADAPTYYVDWDARLCGRFAVLIPAAVAPGQWYWRLVQARWYDEHEPPFDGQHHIFVDVRDAGGGRQTGVPVRFSSLDGGQTFEVKNTEAKPGELYALDFPMQAVAPAYRAAPHNGAPADNVSGLGMGNFQHPDWPIHTSYLLVWQWTRADGDAAPNVCGGANPTPTATQPVVTPPPTPVTPTATPVTPTPPPTPTPVPVWIDDFGDNYTEPLTWESVVFGWGSTLIETNQRIEIQHSGGASGDVFGGRITSRCWLRGDFDIQVNYQLLRWPVANGVRLALAVTPGDAGVTRVSFASNDGIPGFPAEVYLAQVAGGPLGIQGSGDLSGALRLTRTGSTATGYFRSGNTWVTLQSGTITTADVNFELRSWSHGSVFKGEEVLVTFDNVMVTQGQVTCSRPSTAAVHRYLPLTMGRMLVH